MPELLEKTTVSEQHKRGQQVTLPITLFSKMIVRTVTEDSMEKGAVVIPHSAQTL